MSEYSSNSTIEMRLEKYNMISNLDEIKKITISILKKHDVTKAGLFGSVIHEELNEESDIDILIEIEKTKSLLDLVALKQELHKVLGRQVDLVEYTTVHPRLKKMIIEGQVILI